MDLLDPKPQRTRMAGKPHPDGVEIHQPNNVNSLLPSPHIMLMHDGPDAPKHGGKGSFRIRQVLEAASATLVVRGHAHWKEPLCQLANGTQVLNVDSRAVILTRES